MVDTPYPLKSTNILATAVLFEVLEYSEYLISF